MDPQQAAEPTPKTRVPDTLPVIEPGEHHILTIKRHPIGILGVYAMSGTLLLVTAVLALVMSPEVFSGNTQQAVVGGSVAFLFVAVLCGFFTLISNKVYWNNTWTLTSDSLTQVNQFSLFRRESSQLSLENLEDVTAEQQGVLPRMLNYGVLRVETAGKSGKFFFPFCPNPNYYAEQIIKAREAFEQHRLKEQNIYEQPSQPEQTQSPSQTQPQPQADEEPEIASYEVPGGPDGSV